MEQKSIKRNMINVIISNETLVIHLWNATIQSSLGKIPNGWLTSVNIDENDANPSAMAMMSLEGRCSGPKWWTNL